MKKIVIYIGGKQSRRTKRLALGVVKLRLGLVQEQGPPSQGADAVIPLTETQQVSGPLSYQFVTKKGNPAQVQEGSVVVTLTSNDPAVEPSYDAQTSMVTVKGKQPGAALVTGRIEADADLGDGVVPVSIDFPIEAFSVSAGQAVGGTAGVIFGPPQEQPE